MPDLQKVSDTKEKILSAIQRIGPSFPTRIARETGLSPIFAAAFLSELVSEKRLIMSSMRVGSSPLYIIPGQEAQLENFISHLNHKEREAFEMIKKNKVINDETQDPAIRVALRKIRDFAHPITVKEDNQERLFWKFYSTSDAEAEESIENTLGIKKHKEERKKEKKQEIKEEPEIEENSEQVSEEKPKVKKKKEDIFGQQIKDYLATKEIEILQELEPKKKEFAAKVRIDIPLGKQEYYLIAKDKKKITEEELIVILQRAQLEKMPALIMATGEPDKQAKEYLKEWRNVIKFEQVKL